jgi:hypothetical protein
MYLSYLRAVQTSTQAKFKTFKIKCSLHKRDCQWVCWGMKSNPWKRYIIHLARMICMIKCKTETTSRKMGSRDKRMRKSLSIMMKRKSRRFKLKSTQLPSQCDHNKTDILFQSFTIYL